MFKSEELDNHLKTSDTIKVNSKIFAEWNMNDPENIKKLGNYRYRPSYSSSPYFLLPSTYIDNEVGPIFYYTGATDSDTVVESGLNNQDEPTLFLSPQQKMKMLFSLEDCIKPFRPRSGINKPLYLGSVGNPASKNQFIDDGRSASARRPRYYMASKDDQFKYWTSFRKEIGIPTPMNGMPESETETEVIRGVSFFDSISERNYIEDAVPFVVYNEKVPTNKLVIKMQTNVGEVSLGNLRYNNENNIVDPLFGEENKTTPVRWKIEALKNNSWETLTSFDENSFQEDGSPLVGPDGYLEISYGLEVPKEYENIFIFSQELSSITLLPNSAPNGYAYLVKETDEDLGTFYIYVDGEWNSFIPVYGWHLSSQDISDRTDFVKKLVNPEYFIFNDSKFYREFDFIEGIRVVVQTMNKVNCTFDLIEFSPRLLVDISDSVNGYSITKTMSDLGNSSIPVGGLFASSGSIEIFDTDFSFNENNIFNEEENDGSIVYKYLDGIIKFTFYEKIFDVDIDAYEIDLNYYIPVKSMYAHGFPQTISPASILSLQLRDFFFFLESSPAPQLLLTDISLSYATMILLDYIGFDNYIFKRVEDNSELIIPYFFVEQGQNVAEVLQKLAIASQSAMFFDEYNNFVVMSKEYLLPESEDKRATDSTLLGQETAYDKNGNSYLINGFVYEELELPNEKDFGCYINLSNDYIYVWSDITNSWEQVEEIEKINRPNVIAFSSKDKRVYNAGQINYTTRYLQRSIGSTSSAVKIDEYKNYIYKPVILWEAQGNTNRQTINELAGQMGGYVLGAVPLNTNLSDQPPYSLNNVIYNNIIDVGENVYWMTNYQGYLYSAGEIIKYDAIEYIISGQTSPVWITNNQQYQDYFGGLPFNGKMYPSGRIRIYTEPEFEEFSGEIRIKDSNPIPINGRGQFGTQIVSHAAGIDEYWINNENVGGCIQEAANYLFTTSQYIDYPKNLKNIEAGKVGKINDVEFETKDLAQQSLRGGIIKNFLSEKYFTETDLAYKKTTDPGSVQSSALVFSGPKISEAIPSANIVSYIYKDFINEDGSSTPYRHYGTRMRLVGNIESGTNKSQSPLGNFPVYTGSSDTNSSSATITTTNQEEFLRAGSGGLSINIDKERNTGYYFEIMALTSSNISLYNNGNNSNVVSYNILLDPPASSSGTTVTIYTSSEVNYNIGQNILVSGLSVPQLNGEFVITSIDEGKKTIQYELSESLNATSTTGGTVSSNVAENTEIANIFFYKVVAFDKSNIIISYERSDNILTINIKENNLFKEKEKIDISIPEIQGTYTITSSEDNIITMESQGEDISLTSIVTEENNISLTNALAIPYKLWSGLSQINVDSGEFYGQGRLMGEENSTVYDLAAEYINIGSSRRFFLYINNKQIAVVDDDLPLEERNSFALFTRGESKCMFENVYALKNNYSQNSIFPVTTGVAQIFGDEEIDATEALRKYSLSGIVQKTFLSGMSSLEDPKYNIYYEEFGTIMREAAYFNVLYDRAFPALYAKLMKTTNNLKGYTVSGFYAWSYGAEFLIFNNCDFAISLDDTSGNYLRILGAAFTQSTSYTLTVDDLYKKRSNLIDKNLETPSTIYDPFIVNKEYNKLKNSREKYGKNEITIESPYIQSTDAAENVFGWIIDKVSKPKKMIGLTTFGTQNLQLGDIVSVKYLSKEGIDVIVPESQRFVIYQIDYSQKSEGPETTMYLAEV